MADIEVRNNLPEFSLALRSFGREFEQRTVRAATASAAGVFKRLAMSYAPVRTGRLKRAMYIKRSKRSTAGAEHYFVSFRQGKRFQRVKRKGGAVNLDAYYGRFLEAGWMPRAPGQKLRGGRRSVALQRGRNRAAGAAEYSHPFLRPAFERGRTEALRVFYARIQTRIDKENRRR